MSDTSVDTPAVIELLGVTLRREGRAQPVLRDVSLRLQAGERVALLGANGSGKSTLVRLLNGALLPDAGQVRVAGVDTARQDTLRQVRRHVGILLQDPDNQFVTTTAEREIAFGLENLQQPPESMRVQVQQALRDFDLERYRHTPPHEMSGGEKARLALATVWVMGTTVLVLDETDSLLDRRARELLATLIAALAPATVVLHATTDPERANEADRILVLHDGQLIADGEPDQVWQQLPENVATHLGVPLLWRVTRQLQRSGHLPRATASWDVLRRELRDVSTPPRSVS